LNPGSASVVQERQRERLQIEPADSFSVGGIESVALNAVLSELAQVPIAKVNQRHAPITIGSPAANVSLGTRKRLGDGH
jgi:hypothetical protein